MALDRSSTIDDLSAFYQEGYSVGGAAGARAGAWRDLGARVKARNILELSAPTGDDWRCLDVGCGNGVVLAHLAAVKPGWKLAGVEIADAPIALAERRLPSADIRAFDGTTLDWPDQSFDLAYATHVIEHVPDPIPLLREMARVASRVVVEVPLEDNRSARRPSRRAIAEQVGHVQRFSKQSMRDLMSQAGLTVTAGRSDPLERAAHTFYADGARAKLIANAKWVSRAAVHTLAPPLARRLFTVHYSCIAVAARD